MDIIYPTPLKFGDTIALVAPASVPIRENIDRFAADWRQCGYEVHVSDNVFDRNGYLAGNDAERAASFMQAYEDPSVAAIFAVRGGYGVNRMIDLLDFEVIRNHPKIFAGFSDMTTMHAALNRHAGLVTFHAPHGNDGLDPQQICDRTKQSFLDAVTQPASTRPLCDTSNADLRTIMPGKASGRLTGGNLAVLASTIGTPFAPDFMDKILFLEDIGEEPYRLDRYLSQLKLAGCLGEVAGILLGHFTDCEPKEPSTSQFMHEVFADYFEPLGVPILAGIPCGHDLPNLTLPMNAMVEVDADTRMIRIEPASRSTR